MRGFVARLLSHASLFSRFEILKWIAITSVVSTVMVFLSSPGFYGGPVGIAFSASNYIGYLFVLGIPHAVGAALLFCSTQTQHNIIDMKEDDEDASFSFLIIIYSLLTVLMMVFISVAGYIAMASATGLWASLSYLPQLVILTLIISVLLCPFHTFIVLVFDDTKKGLAAGILLSIAVAFATGFPGVPSNFPELAFLGASNILAAALYLSVGGFGSFSYWYVGLPFEPVHMIGPVLIFVLLSAISFMAGKKMFLENIPRWLLERDRWLEERQSPAEQHGPEHFANLAKMNAELKSRQKYATILSLILIFLIPLGGTGYATFRRQEWTTIVYESPAEGEYLDIGEWTYGSFTGYDVPENMGLKIGCEGRILNWQGGVGEIHYTFNHRRMTLSEFQQLNATEIEDMFGRQESGRHGTTGEFGGGWGGPIRDEEYIWVLRFNNVNEQTTGRLTIWFQVILRAI